MVSTAQPPIPLTNEYGWTSTIPNPITCRWLEYLRTVPAARTIDIGAGFGVGTLPALALGARVVANDISQQQLQHIAQLAQQAGLRQNLELLEAALPELPPLKGLDAIHASNVFHFLRGSQMIAAVSWMASAVKSDGKVFLQTVSPFAGHLQRFLPEYQRRKREDLRWPGEIEAARDYADASVRHMTPPFMHVLESFAAVALFEAAGFTVEYADYYTRPGLPAVCRSDGRENLGVVAIRN